MKSKTLSLKSIKKKLNFLKKTIVIQRNTWEKRFVVARKKINRKNPLPRNAKEQYQSYVRKKNRKSEIITYQPKTLEDPSTFGIKSLVSNKF